jgi:hypothetical protein
MGYPNAAILGDTCKMELHTDSRPVAPAWRIYIAGWLIYMVIVAFLIQIDHIFAARFSWKLALTSMWSTVPPALLLGLVWPVTGYLERKGNRRLALIGVHVLLGLSFALVSHFLLLALVGEDTKPMSWYAWPFMYSLMSYTFIAATFHTVRANAVAQRQTVAMHQARNLLIAAELSALHRLRPVCGDRL